MDATRPVARPLEGRGKPETGSTPPILDEPLYKHGRIEVGTEWFVINGYHYPVTELANLRIARGPHHPITVRAMVIAVVVLFGLATTVGLAGTPTEVPGITYLAMGAAFIVPFVLGAVGERIRPRTWELWADYFGITVRLLTTDNHLQFGQVARALLRAQEIARMGASAELRDLEPWRSWRRMASRR